MLDTVTFIHGIYACESAALAPEAAERAAQLLHAEVGDCLAVAGAPPGATSAYGIGHELWFTAQPGDVPIEVAAYTSGLLSSPSATLIVRIAYPDDEDW